MTTRFLVGEVFDVMADLPDQSVDLVLTSPPFLGLRSYLPEGHPDKGREIGAESTPAEYLDTMMRLTAEWGRLLTPHGSLCVEIGDTYSGSGGAGGDYNDGGLRDGQQRFDGSAAKARRLGVVDSDRSRPPRTNRGGRCAASADLAGKGDNVGGHHLGGEGWPMDKSLTGVPTLYAWSLAYGWNLLRPGGGPSPAGLWRIRNLVVWARPNPPVGALGDKIRPATSYLTWACRSGDRWFDLFAVRRPPKGGLDPGQATGGKGLYRNHPREDESVTRPDRVSNPAGAPPLDWWSVSPDGYRAEHFAVWPAELCRIPIEASCPRRVCRTCGRPSRRLIETTNAVGHAVQRRAHRMAPDLAGDGRVGVADINADAPDAAEQITTGWSSCGCPGTDGIRLDGFHEGDGWRPGIVLDPFAGSGTTLMVAHGLCRDAIGIDLDERNVELARGRLGMFLDTAEHVDRGLDVVETAGLL